MGKLKGFLLNIYEFMLIYKWISYFLFIIKANGNKCHLIYYYKWMSIIFLLKGFNYPKIVCAIISR